MTLRDERLYLSYREKEEEDEEHETNNEEVIGCYYILGKSSSRLILIH